MAHATDADKRPCARTVQTTGPEIELKAHASDRVIAHADRAYGIRSDVQLAFRRRQRRQRTPESI